MRQAIVTKYLPVTNTKGARVKASGSLAGSITDHWDHGGSVEENHCRVAKLLAASRGWSGLYVAGGTKDGLVFVAVPKLAETMTQAPGRDRDWFYVEEREA